MTRKIKINQNFLNREAIVDNLSVICNESIIKLRIV